MTPAPGIAYHPDESGPERTGSRSLTRAGVADAIYRRHGGITRREARGLVDAILRCIRLHLASGRSVKISGFGSFRVTRPRARTGGFPAAVAPGQARRRARAAFRPSGRLIGKLNSPRGPE